MKQRLQRVAVLGLLPVVLLCTAAYMYRRVPAAHGDVDTMLLLVPDEIDAGNVVLHEWQDAAEEEGLHLVVMHDSEFLNPMLSRRGARGIIVPDLIHRKANGSLIGALHDYAQQGGKVMIVYDACTWDLGGFFSKVESRLSDMVGVSYAMYDKYKVESIEKSQIWGTRHVMAELDVPPGKFVSAHDSLLIPQLKQTAAKASLESQPSPNDVVITRYEYGDVQYPSFRTEGNYDGEVLLQSTGGLVAGVRQHGAGKVLFVNLPLGYLEARTDGLMLHSFLRYFAVKVIGLPYLSPAPDGIGGLIFNWHVDAESSVGPLKQLLAAHVFDQGPYSIHVTAGPDVENFGDGKGLDLEHNPDAQRLLSELMHRGHVIGSHGGWIHNYFGTNLSDTNQADFAKYIQWNVAALQKFSGKQITEYSAPLGNQPRWVSQWLEQNGITAYYFAGDTGMAPTQVYRDQTRDGASIWAFPIVHLGKYASLEEMSFDAVPSDIVTNWLMQSVDFTANNQSVRLIYTHPLGATHYMAAMQTFLQHTAELGREHRFRWYSMTDIADFMNARKSVQWTAESTAMHSVLLQAEAPKSLAHQTWIFSKSLYTEPQVRQGFADVTSRGGDWLVTARDCKQLAVEMGQR